ncbi:MAG: dihydrofolate reductase family protein [Nibricoccus sp.]
MRLTLIAAQSLDGFITRHDMPGSAFASEADRTWFREALRDFDCCVMGGETYRTAREMIRASLMPERLRVVVTRSPDAFVRDATPGKLEFVASQPAALVATLHARGFQRCAILGGSQIHSLFLEAALIDEFWLTVEPLLFGGGIPLLARRTSTQLKLLARENLSPDTLLLKYRVEK